MTFSSAGKSRWVEWVNVHRKESHPDNLRPMWAKAEGHCARLALVLFLARKACNETKDTCLGRPSIDGAIKLIEYFKSYARRVYGSMADRSNQRRIGNALRWIRKHGGTVTARKANMYGLCKDSDAAKELLKDLEELGYGTVTNEPRGSVVFRPNGTTVRSSSDAEETMSNRTVGVARTATSSS